LIQVRNLTKKYGPNTVVKGLTFTIEKGRIYGFLGPNGAGKTTTLNMLTGCLAPTEGEIIINGHDIYEEPEEAKRSIGYLPEQPPLYMDMTPYEYLCFVAEAKGVDRAEVDEAVRHVMEETHILEMAGRLIKNLSKGYRQRVGIAQAMLGNPDLIILDEPTVGLDPKQIIEIRELIARLGENHTVLLSSHILAEVSAICDYVMIISNGRLVAADTLENIRRSQIKENSVTVTARAPQDKIEEVLDKIDGIVKYDMTAVPSVDEVWDVVIDVDEGIDIRERLFTEFAAAGVPLRKLSSAEPSLEEVFLQLTSEDRAARGYDIFDEVLGSGTQTDADTEDEEADAFPGYDIGDGKDEENNGDDDFDDGGDEDDDYYVPMFRKTADEDEGDDEE
jgi:ABC-2 type transport system ATP-binding protein